MSILPSDVNGNPSSSNGSRSVNSNFDNGRLQSSNFLRLSGGSSGDLGAEGSNPITDSDRNSIRCSDSIPVPATDYNRSSNRVIALKSPSVWKNYGQSYCAPLGCSTSGQGGVSSHVLREQLNGKQTGHSIATGSLQNNLVCQSSRKNHTTNVYHLLNFRYDSISRTQPKVLPPRRQQKVKPYNKDLFLQANYKFVILDVDDHAIRSMDPDKMFDWEDVVCVRYSSPNPVQCPICLESPLCPQITTCGHVFCFTCILRYLLMGEEDHKGDCWKKCPLCFTMVSVKDLYTLYIDYVKQYQVGDHVDFTLLTRAKYSMVPSEKTDGDCVGSSSDTFSKLTVTSDVEMSVRDAKLQLSDWLVKAEAGQVEDLEQLPYVCAALEQLDLRKKAWTEHRAFSSSPLKDVTPCNFNTKPCKYTSDKKPSRPTKVRSTHEGSSSVESMYINHESCASDLDILKVVKEVEEKDFTHLSYQQETLETSEKDTSSDLGSKGFYKQFGDRKNNRQRYCYTFYQAVDGQLLILHPINMRCLLHHYGSYDLLPARIGGGILQLETVTQSETMRKRYRFLSHFSLTTSFQLCEIDISHLLPPDALFPFMNEIKKRDYQRKCHAKQEEEKARGMAAESVSSTHIKSVNSFTNFTSFSEEDFQALGSSPISSTSPPLVGERKLFSDVTRLGFASAYDSPSLRAEPSAVVAGAETASQTCSSGSTTISFASIISAAAKSAGDPEAVKMNGTGNGKKGKKASKVLLSTAGGRRY